MKALTRRTAFMGLTSLAAQTAGAAVPQTRSNGDSADVLSVGLFIDIQRQSIPLGTGFVRTMGYARDGVGAALYQVGPPNGQALRSTAWRRLSLNNRWVEFIGEAVTPDQLGYAIDPVGALRAYGDLCQLNRVRLTFERGRTYSLPSADLGVRGISLPEGAIVDGGDALVQITGGSICNLWVTRNASNVKLRNLRHIGNNRAAQYGAGAAVTAELGPEANVNLSGLEIANCRFENFKANWWIWIQNNSNKFSIEKPIISNNKFYSRNGNAQDGGLLGNLAACMAFISLNSSGSYINDPDVRGNFADIPDLKIFCAFFAGVVRGLAQDNEVMRCGTSPEIKDNAAAYAFLIYDASEGRNPPDYCRVMNCKIHAVRSVGVYVAGGPHFQYDVWVGGQTDKTESGLPKGAVALNGVLESRGRLRAENCVYGLSLVSPLHNEATCEVDLECHNCTTAFFYAAIDGHDLDQLTFSRFVATNVGVGIHVQTSAAAAIKNLTLKHFDIDASGWAVNLVLAKPQAPALNQWRLQGVVRNGGLHIAGYNNPAGEIIIEDVRFEGQASPTRNLCAINDCSNISLDHVIFTRAPQDGYCLNTNGTTGRMKSSKSIQFVDVPLDRRISPDSVLGFRLPTWKGKPGDIVQMVGQPVEQIASWRNGAWVISSSAPAGG